MLCPRHGPCGHYTVCVVPTTWFVWCWLSYSPEKGLSFGELLDSIHLVVVYLLPQFKRPVAWSMSCPLHDLCRAHYMTYVVPITFPMSSPHCPCRGHRVIHAKRLRNFCGSLYRVIGPLSIRLSSFQHDISPGSGSTVNTSALVYIKSATKSSVKTPRQ